MRSRIAAILVTLLGVFAVSAAGAEARTSPPGLRVAQVSPSLADEVSPRPRVRRPGTRLRVTPSYRPEPDGVYPRYFPGRNAVRSCSVKYVQEFRPSGTVITPHMSCVWRQG